MSGYIDYIWPFALYVNLTFMSSEKRVLFMTFRLSFSIFLAAIMCASQHADGGFILSVDLDRDTDGVQSELTVGPNFQGRGSVVLDLVDDGSTDVGLTGYQFSLDFSPEVQLGLAGFEFQPAGFPPPPSMFRSFETISARASNGDLFSTLGSVTESNDGILGVAAGAADSAQFQFNGFSQEVLQFNYAVSNPVNGTFADISLFGVGAVSAVDGPDADNIVDSRFDFTLNSGTLNATAVPEPSSLLALLATSGICALGRRRRK